MKYLQRPGRHELVEIMQSQCPSIFSKIENKIET